MAAPTAGLHFTDRVFGKLKAKLVGTFSGVVAQADWGGLEGGRAEV